MSVGDFVSALSAHADATDQTALRPIIERLTRPIRCRTTGRAGVGRRTLAAALREAGLTVVDTHADVELLVIAETAKPEDCRLIGQAEGPVVTALNKAELLGAEASDRARAVRRLTDTTVIPVSALLATARLDGAMIAAVQVLATEPADLSSADAFMATGHPLDGTTRARLLASIDVVGLRAAVAAVRAGADDRALTALLRGLSNIDEVLAGVHAAAAPMRYRRLCTSMTRLRALAARTADAGLDAVMAGDIAVLAAMEAATEVVRADGLDAGPDDPRRSAVRWQRYSRGPVNALHRRCGADIARGALRLGVS